MAGPLSVIETFRGQSRVIDRDDLELLALGLITRDIPSAGTGAWLDECSPDGLIEILWQVGLLLAERPTREAAPRCMNPGRPAGVPFLGPHQALLGSISLRPSVSRCIPCSGLTWAPAGPDGPGTNTTPW